MIPVKSEHVLSLTETNSFETFDHGARSTTLLSVSMMHRRMSSLTLVLPMSAVNNELEG